MLPIVSPDNIYLLALLDFMDNPEGQNSAINWDWDFHFFAIQHQCPHYFREYENNGIEKAKAWWSSLHRNHFLPKASHNYRKAKKLTAPPPRTTLATPGLAVPTTAVSAYHFSMQTLLSKHFSPRASAFHNSLFLPWTHLLNWTRGRQLFPDGACQNSLAKGRGRFPDRKTSGPNTNKTYFPAEIWSSITEPCLTSKGNTLHCNLSCMNYTHGCQ